MSTMVPMYGFGGGPGGTGATLTVTAPAGCTVTVSTDVATSSGAQLFDIKDVFRLYHCNIISDDIIEVYCDNTGSASVNFANFYTKKSDILIPSKEYLIIAEVFECSGIAEIHPTSSFNDSAAGQFKTEKDVGAEKGVYVYKSVTKDSFDGCTTMCRGFAKIDNGSIGRAKIRISVIDDLSVTADTFVYRPFTGGTNLRKYSKTKVAGTDGVAVFKGLSTGDWTVVISDGIQTAKKTVTVTADYSTAITFFSATIHVTYLAGSTCTATDGVTTLTAPDTSGTWECVVPNAGTWTVTVTENGWNESVSITENGQSEQVYLNYVYLFKDGNSYESLTGGFGKSGYMYYASSYTLYGPTITESINVSVSKASSACIGGTQKAIDVTNINELSADCTSMSFSGSSPIANLVVTDSARDVQSSRALAYAGLSQGKTTTIDLSGVSGSVYIAVVAAGSSASPSVSAVVNNIKLA